MSIILFIINYKENVPMDNFIKYLHNNLYLYEFTLIKTTHNKAVIFKSFSKYTKCIYINIIDEHIEIKVDKIFDLKGMASGIERLIISKKVFEDINESLNYIQKNVAI